MAQSIVDPTVLDGNIAEVCEKLNQLSKRERDIKTNARTDVDIVERDNLLRKIRVERRDLNRQLAELSVQRSLIENNVGEEHEHDTDDQDEEEDAEEVGAADTQDLDDDRADEYNRLHNLLCRTKVDIKARKEKVENLLKEANDPLLTDSERRQNDVRIKAQLRSIQSKLTSTKCKIKTLSRFVDINLFCNASWLSFYLNIILTSFRIC